MLFSLLPIYMYIAKVLTNLDDSIIYVLTKRTGFSVFEGLLSMG